VPPTQTRLDPQETRSQALAFAVYGAVALVLSRFVAGAVLPLSADEAYYWLWSKHLAAGYLDHPPAIAWLIRAGTAIFGDTPLGVRFWSIVSSAAATWFVWRAAAEHLSDERAGAFAALLFNSSLMVAVEMLAATPDAPAILGASALLYFLVKLERNGNARWWLAAGLAGGAMLLSKFTAIFLAAGVFSWLVLERSARHWLLSPWPWLALGIALLVDLPSLAWNRLHNWETFAFQFARVEHGRWTLRFLAEFVGAQFLLASPALFLMGLLGFARFHDDPKLRLPFYSCAPAILYFVIHALHDRVQANWPSFLMPALVLLAVSAGFMAWPGRAGKLFAVLSRAALPVALVLLAAAYLQALGGVIAAGRADPFTRLLGFGIAQMSKEADMARVQGGALLTTDYASAAWLSFYRPSPIPIVVLGEPDRWAFAARASAPILALPMLYVVEDRLDKSRNVASHFKEIAPVGTVDRLRSGVRVGRYHFYRAQGFDGRQSLHQLP